MRRFIPSALFVTATLLTASLPSLAAEKITGVVELFTSQGCSSCPPADKVLTKLSKEPGILVLAWHVDYWDYLGWEDTLGVKGATERQRAYAAQFRSSSIYTPQAVINGATGLVGSKESQIRNALSQVPFPAFDVELIRSSDAVTVVLPETLLNGVNAVIELIHFVPSTVVEIQRGENAGNSVTYQNAVRSVSALGNWDGAAKTFKADAPLPGQSSAIFIRAILSTGQAGPVIAAAMIDPA